MTLKTKLTSIVLTVVLALAAVVGLSLTVGSAASASTFTAVKYGTTFIYQGGNEWTVINTDNAKALKDIDSTQAVLCSNYDTGLDRPCRLNESYALTSTAFNSKGENCAYVQGDGGSNGSWDTVPNTEKEVCAPTSTPTPTATSNPTPTVSPTETATPSPSPSMTSTPGPTSSASPTIGPSPTPSTQPTSTPGPTPSEAPSSTPSSSVPSQSPTSTTSASPSATSTPTLVCADFSTQNEAQASLPTNPQLDRDGDGIACDTSATPDSVTLATTGASVSGGLITTGVLILLAGIVAVLYTLIKRRE